MSGNELEFQRLMSEGHSAAWDGMWDNAVGSYREALKRSPNHPKALTSIGLALFEIGKYEESLEYYLQAVSVSPGDPIPLEKIGQLYELLEKFKKSSDASLRAAEIYINNRDVDKAIENLSRVTRIDPENKTAHSRLAMIHERLGNKQQAVVEYLALASLMQEEGDMNKAVQAVNRALQILPTSVEAHQALSLLRETKPLPKPSRPRTPAILPQQPRFQQLEAPIESDLQYHEMDPVAAARQKALGVLAGIVFEAGSDDVDQPIGGNGLEGFVSGTTDSGLFQQSDQNKIHRHLGLAVNLQTQKQDAEAVDELKKAIEAGLENPAANFDLGLLFIELEDYESATSSLISAVNHADYALGARLLIGKSLWSLGRLDEAAIEYLEALRIADALVVSARDAINLKQLYDPIIEAESQQTDQDAKETLCENIENMLMRPDWRDRLTQVRKELPVSVDGGPPRPIGEILTEVSSSQVVESIAFIRKLAREGHIRTAMEEAFYALQYAPTYLPLHINIGELLLQQELQPLAINKFTVVGQTYSSRGESSLAIDLFRRVINLAPMELSTRYRLINELINAGNKDEAIGEYLRLADVHYNLADLRLARKTFGEALQLAQQSRMDDSIKVQILHRIADIDVQRLDWRQALKVYEHIRSIQPDDRRARSRLVELNFRLGQESQAMTELDHFLSRFLTGGQTDEAIRFLEELVQEVPSQKFIQKRLIDLYRHEGRKTDAIKFLDAMGQRLMLIGDREGAIEVVEMILALDPPNAEEYRKLLKKIHHR